MIYEIINPSDAVTIETDDMTLARVAALVLGEGAYGLTDENGTAVLPVLLFGGAEEWLKENDLSDFGGYVSGHREQLATCLESAVYGSINDRKAILATAKAAGGNLIAALAAWNDTKRSSLNDIGGRAHSLAKALRRPRKD